MSSDGQIDFMTMVAWDWGKRCFGTDHMCDEEARGERFVEEAIETCQALGIEPERVHQIVDMVYSKKVGEINRELGGSALTLAVLCHTLNTGLQEVFEVELLRVLSLDPSHFAQRNADKVKLLNQGAKR